MTWTPRRLPFADEFDGPRGRDVLDVQPAAGDLGQADVAGDHDVLGAAGIPPRPSRIDSKPSFMTPPTVSSGTWQCCMMTRSNILAYSKRLAHQAGVGHRGAVVGEGDRAAGDELAEGSASSCPFRPLLTAPTG